MYRQPTIVLMSVLSVGASCTPGVSSPPTPGPVPPPTSTIEQTAVRSYRFIPSTYRYRFQQTANIWGDGPADSIPSSITTHGVFIVLVASEPDSAMAVTLSIDSISITSQGSIPSRGLQQLFRLDSVITTRFTQSEVVNMKQLPDSLCEYTQFVAMGRELLLPELGIQIHSPTRQVFRDTLSYQVCRAGTTIDLTTTRELQDLNRNPAELRLEQETRIHGGGMLRRDSISIAGSLTTQGTIAFTAGNRLPSLIQTQSEGTITVQLGNTRTVFRQTSTQETRLEGIRSP